MLDDEDFVAEHEGVVAAIVIGSIVAVVICVLLIFYGGEL